MMDFIDRIKSRAEQRRLGTYLGDRLGKGLCSLQHDFDIGNGSGAAVRADLNDALEALVTQSSGPTAPSTTYAYQVWADTANGLLKQRNAANTVWIVRRSLAESFVTFRASNTILGVSDFGKPFVATSTYTQTLTAAATLGDGWFCWFRVNSGATLTIDPNSSENIDGATTKVIVGPASGAIFCSGTAFFTYGFDNPAASETVAGVIELATQAEVNAMTDTSRAMTPNHNKIVISAEQTGSGSSLDFTGIPAGVRRFTVNFAGLSTNGTSPVIIQLGDSGGIETSGYNGTSSSAGGTMSQFSSGFIVSQVSGGSVLNGSFTFDLQDPSDFTWTGRGTVGHSNTINLYHAAGAKSLTAELDRVRVTTAGGTDNFDAGAVSVSWER